MRLNAAYAQGPAAIKDAEVAAKFAHESKSVADLREELQLLSSVPGTAPGVLGVLSAQLSLMEANLGKLKSHYATLGIAESIDAANKSLHSEAESTREAI